MLEVQSDKHLANALLYGSAPVYLAIPSSWESRFWGVLPATDGGIYIQLGEANGYEMGSM